MSDRASWVLLSILWDVTWKGSLLVGLAAGVAWVLRRRGSAALRHLVWALCVVGLLLLPVLSVGLPGWRVLPRWGPGRRPAVPEARSLVRRVPAVQLRGNPSPVSPMVLERSVRSGVPAGGNMDSLAAPPLAQQVGGGGHRPAGVWLCAAWLLGALLVLLRLPIGSLKLRLLSRASEVVDGTQCSALLDDLARSLDFRGAFRVLRSRRDVMPMAWGLFRPTILLPACSATWPEERRRAVLCHELAHAKRRDGLSHFITHVCCALYWFHPLVWFAAHRLAEERERACDDLVLAAGAEAENYADLILATASELLHGPAASPAIPMARRLGLEKRLSAIVDTDRNREPLGLLQRLVVPVVALCLAVPLAVLRAAEPPPAPAAPAGGRATEKSEPANRVTNGIGVQFILVRPGDLTVPDRLNGGTRELRVERPFYLGAFEVTQEQWKEVMGAEPSVYEGPGRPVEMVSWVDCVEFCKRLSALDGRSYRLPTSAEWEYACRAGSTAAYCFGDDAGDLGGYAWYAANSGDGIDTNGRPVNGTTHPVGGKKPNAWGFHDMHGNVREWCQDEGTPSARGLAHRKKLAEEGVPFPGSWRLMGGGCYAFPSSDCWCYHWQPYPDIDNSFVLGLRVVLVAGKPSGRAEVNEAEPDRGVAGVWRGVAADKPGGGTSRDTAGIEISESPDGRPTAIRVRGELAAGGEQVVSGPINLKRGKLTFRMTARDGPVLVWLSIHAMASNRLVGEVIPTPENEVGDFRDIVLTRTGNEVDGGGE